MEPIWSKYGVLSPPRVKNYQHYLKKVPLLISFAGLITCFWTLKHVFRLRKCRPSRPKHVLIVFKISGIMSPHDDFRWWLMVSAMMILMNKLDNDVSDDGFRPQYEEQSPKDSRSRILKFKTHKRRFKVHKTPRSWRKNTRKSMIFCAKWLKQPGTGPLKII